MARLGRQDWIDEGLKVLTEVGYEGIKIDRLCKRLDISIGSFYHHFKNIEDYIEKMILEWEIRSHSYFAGILEREVPAKERLEMLHEVAFDNPPKFECAVRSWSFKNAFIERSVEKIDKKRVRLLTSLFSELGFKLDVSRQLAEVEYAAYLGVQIFSMNKSKHSAKKLFNAFNLIMRAHQENLSAEVGSK